MHDIALLRWMETYRGVAAQIARVDNIEIACQMTVADGGIAVLPCFVADAVPNLERVFAEHVGLNSGWIVYHETLREAARIRVTVKALADTFKRNAAMFSGA